MKMRTRIEESANYKSVFINGKTLRFAIDNSKPITELAYPEFYDVSFGTKCLTGQSYIKQKDGSKKNCHYCYASAALHGEYFKNVVEKVKWFFGQMTDNQRPTQWAAGGSSEALEHKDFWKASEAARELDIIPNYTTNGMLVTDEVAARTNELEAGSAITLHPHMEIFWRRAIKIFQKHKVRMNVHVIVSDEESVLKFEKQYHEFKDCVEWFVVLPYMNVGHAAKFPKKRDYDAIERIIDKIYHEGKVAFGANMVNWLYKVEKKYRLQLYSPEIMSKYLTLDGDQPKVYNNSFELKPVPFNHKTGCELGHARVDFDIDKIENDAAKK